jgi:hypothetical protein
MLYITVGCFAAQEVRRDHVGLRERLAIAGSRPFVRRD